MSGAKMVRARSSLCIAFALLFVLAICSNTATQPHTNAQPSVTSSPVASNQPFQLKHIFYIMMENHDASQIFGNTSDAPYLNQLANSYGIATRYYGVTHPSLPNYLCAISGSFQGVL